MSNVSEFESRRAALVAEISTAFDGVSRKGGTTLHEAEAMDDWKSPEEQRAARRLDPETRWQEVPDADIYACCSALSFLNEEGFRYYLPAFMVYSLRHWGDDWNGILNACEYHLLHEAPKSLRQSDPANIAGKYQLTAAQSKAVARFLRFIIDFDETQAARATVEAVERWERYAQERSAGRDDL
jgi:hypothetical protein